MNTIFICLWTVILVLSIQKFMKHKKYPHSPLSTNGTGIYKFEYKPESQRMKTELELSIPNSIGTPK